MRKEIKITTAYGDEIIIEGWYTESVDHGYKSSIDPSSFDNVTVYELDENNNLIETDKFDINYCAQIACDLADHEDEKITLNQSKSKAIINTDKYFAIDERDFLAYELRSLFDRKNNTRHEDAMIMEIARKLKYLGFDYEVSDGIEVDFKSHYNVK